MSTVEKSIDVDVPVRTAYNQWTQFESFPQFMEGVDRIDQTSDTMTHWVTSIGGVTREFDAEITEQRPDERVAWTSVDGPKNAGVVTFHRLGPGKTRIMLQMDFEPEGVVENGGDKLGIVGRLARALARPEPATVSVGRLVGGGVGVLLVREQPVRAPAGIRERGEDLFALLVRADPGHLPGGHRQLGELVAEALGDRPRSVPLLLPRRLTLARLDLGAAGLGEREQPAPAGLVRRDQALVGEQLQGRVDRAGARPPHAAGALLDLLDDLVAVHRPLREQCKHGRADVAAPGAAPPAPAVPARSEGACRPAEAGTEAAEVRTEARSPAAEGAFGTEGRVTVVLPAWAEAPPAAVVRVHRALLSRPC